MMATMTAFPTAKMAGTFHNFSARNTEQGVAIVA